jgi:hypothetical protein
MIFIFCYCEQQVEFNHFYIIITRIKLKLGGLTATIQFLLKNLICSLKLINLKYNSYIFA